MSEPFVIGPGEPVPFLEDHDPTITKRERAFEVGGSGNCPSYPECEHFDRETPSKCFRCGDTLWYKGGIRWECSRESCRYPRLLKCPQGKGGAQEG
jgi:hypothetical protein